MAAKRGQRASGQAGGVPSVERIRAKGAHQARSIAISIAQELRDARIAAGLSQDQLASAAGLRQSRISRTERAELPTARLDELVRHCVALGLRLSVRPYPAGTPVRDAAQLRLLARFRGMLDASYTWRSEVPVGGKGDLRAWDALLEGPGVVAIDAETRLRDMQALQRRTELKQRDSGVPCVVLLVADTHHNRAVLRDHRPVLASTFPLDTRAVMSALRAGRVPSASGIAII
jgi:transcriptional regulator with XRE-family HTH domain